MKKLVEFLFRETMRKINVDEFANDWPSSTTPESHLFSFQKQKAMVIRAR